MSKLHELVCFHVFSAFTLLVAWQEGHPACKKTEWWGAGMVICLERGADLHAAQLMPLPLTVSCFSKIQTGSFLVPAHLGSPGKRAVKRVCQCVLFVFMSVQEFHRSSHCDSSPGTIFVTDCKSAAIRASCGGAAHCAQWCRARQTRTI